MTNATSDYDNRSAEPAPRTARLWIWLPWALAVALAASTTWLAIKVNSRPVVQQPAEQPPPAATAPAPAPAQPPRANLEPWPDGKSAVELLGYSNVHAYRWSGGVLTGWVEFDDGPKPRRVPIDLNEVIAKSSKAKPSDFSGQVVVARRLAGKGPGQECWVWVRVEQDINFPGPENKGRLGQSTVYNGPWKARGDTEGRVATDRQLVLFTKPQGEPFSPDTGGQWLELRVGAPAEKNAK